MRQRFNMQSTMDCKLVKPPNSHTHQHQPSPPKLTLEFPMRGQFEFWHYNKNGHLLERIRINNGITDEGVASAYDTIFGAGSQITAWFIGLIDNSGYTQLLAADTMANHAGWNEFTMYSEETRPAWIPGATAARQIASSASTSFSITGSGTIKGGFLVSNSTKSGTTGTIWSTGLFANPQTVANGETLKVTYSLTG